MEKQFILGVDVGGSHITAALTDAATGSMIEESITRKRVDANAQSEMILEQWVNTLRLSLANISLDNLNGIGFAMPGPFNYTEGISMMKGRNKYDALYGINVSKAIRQQLNLVDAFPIVFENDACCFGLGESFSAEAKLFTNVIAITLGTGFGAAFIKDNQIQKDGDGIPPGGLLYNVPYKEGIAENYISGAWLLDSFNSLSGDSFTEVLQIAERAIDQHDQNALEVFRQFGGHLTDCLIPWIKSFKAGCLVIGGSISKSSQLFISPMQTALLKEKIDLTIKISTLMELSAITGSASLVK